jgi:hypothetical protein
MDGSTSSVTKLIDLLPLIVISVIVLVGFFTWDIFTKHLEPFILLITSILFAIWLYSGNIYSYLDWKKAHDAGAQYMSGPKEGAPEISTIIIIVIIIGLSLLGFGLFMGIMSYKIGNTLGSVTSDKNIVSYVGYGLTGLGGFILISLLWKGFKGQSSKETNTSNSSDTIFGSTTFKIISGIFLSLIGIYVVAHVSIIGVAIGLKSVAKGEVNDSSSETNSLSIASTVLNVGLIFQSIAVLAGVYMMYRYKWFHPDTNVTNPVIAMISRFAPFVLLLAAGIIFFAVQQKWIKSDEGIGAGDDNNNIYVAHGIIYMILAGITLLAALGRLTTFTLFKGAGWVSALGVIGVVIWNFISLNQQSNFDLTVDDEKNGNAYYQQVKDEVTKELKSSGKPEDVTEENIKSKIEKRMGELNTSNDKAVKTVNNSLLSIAVLIITLIGLFYAAKMKIVECMRLPVEFTNIFTGKCDTETDYKKNKALDRKLSGNAANIEKMNADDWDNVLDTHNEDDNNFSKVAVNLAAYSRWIPVMTIILVVICISILFTKVTTSEATMEWIAKSFRGDMFPKVKSLLDTFFIVFIVGLLLCSILLLPMVREQTVGGLDVITNFIDSIQVWQYKERTTATPHDGWNYFWAIVGPIVVLGAGLSWYWTYLGTTRNNDTSLPIVPENFILPLVAVILFAICCIPAFFHLPGSEPHSDFQKDNMVIRGLRLFFTSVYLVPLMLFSLFKLVLYFIISYIGGIIDKPDWGNSFIIEKAKWEFWNWKAAATTNAEPDHTKMGPDLRMFGLGKILLPKDVVSKTSRATEPNTEKEAIVSGEAQAVLGSDELAIEGEQPNSAASAEGGEGVLQSIDQSKVNAVGKLIKVIFIIIVFVIMILGVIYTFYKFGSENKPPKDASNYEDATQSFTQNLSSPTAYAIYAIIGIVAIAGFIAYIREKFKSANTKTPEDYLFNDLKPEDSNNPMRQLTFGMTHIIYIILMIVVLIYDTDTDDKGRMSVIGITVLGVAIILFHYVLELIDNKELPKPGAAADEVPRLAPMSNLLSNIRFIVNTVFLIILSVLAYYKQHSVMIALIVIMFFFHLSKSILGVKLLKLLWACIIYIPCLFLDLLKSSQSAVGDTTRTIWIIVAIEVLLIAILYGMPYLINYIGASASQIVARPVSLKQLYDTNLTTQSKEIFIYHNTGIDRTDADNAANCAPEEKKRYHYAISGWFFLNNNINTKTSDLEIFNFGDVPKMTYNPSKNELKIICGQLSMADGGVSTMTELYNSRKNYKAVNRAGHATIEELNQQTKSIVEMSLEGDELDADILLQRWNYFVINYDGKTMDFFLNNKLIFKSEFIMPDIQLKPITVGSTTDNKGLNGSICNFAFHKYPLTKEQIRWTYNMLKSQNPPIIGMSTVEDQVNVTDTTKVYSR